jgi:hypothetical protein
MGCREAVTSFVATPRRSVAGLASLRHFTFRCPDPSRGAEDVGGTKGRKPLFLFPERRGWPENQPSRVPDLFDSSDWPGST